MTMAAALGVCTLAVCWRAGPASLVRLASLRLRGSWMLFAAALCQIALVAGGLHPFWCTLGALLLIGAFNLLNYSAPGVTLACVGAFLNFAVMLAYDGRMPVHPVTAAWLAGAAPTSGEIVAGTKGVLAAGDSPLLLLGDWLPLPGAVTGVALWSPGDLLLLAGITVLLTRTIRGELDHVDPQ